MHCPLGVAHQMLHRAVHGVLTIRVQLQRQRAVSGFNPIFRTRAFQRELDGCGSVRIRRNAVGGIGGPDVVLVVLPGRHRLPHRHGRQCLRVLLQRRLQALSGCIQLHLRSALGSNTTVPPQPLAVTSVVPAVRRLQCIRIQCSQYRGGHRPEITPAVALVRRLVGGSNGSGPVRDVCIDHPGCLPVQQRVPLRVGDLNRPQRPIIAVHRVGHPARPLATCRIKLPVACVYMRSIHRAGWLCVGEAGLHPAQRLLGSDDTGQMVQFARLLGQRKHGLILQPVDAVIAQIGAFLAQPLLAVELPSDAIAVALRKDLPVIPERHGLVGSRTEQIRIGHHQRNRARAAAAHQRRCECSTRPTARALRRSVQHLRARSGQVVLRAQGTVAPCRFCYFIGGGSRPQPCNTRRNAATRYPLDSSRLRQHRVATVPLIQALPAGACMFGFRQHPCAHRQGESPG